MEFHGTIAWPHVHLFCEWILRALTIVCKEAGGVCLIGWRGMQSSLTIAEAICLLGGVVNSKAPPYGS
jgi:hypothetical protein